MSESFTPTATAPTFPITLPLDGEIINHANLIDGMIKKGLDYTAATAASAAATAATVAAYDGSPHTWTGANTFADLTMTGTNNVKLASRSITRIIETTPMAAVANWDPLVITSFGAPIGAVWENLIVSTTIAIPLHIPNGATLTAITLTFAGAPGHAAFPGGAPDNMPVMYIRSQPLAFGAGSMIGTTTDTTATEAAYEAYHTLAVTGLSTVIDKTANQYFCYLRSEGGSNSIVGTRLASCQVTYTITAMDED